MWRMMLFFGKTTSASSRAGGLASKAAPASWKKGIVASEP